MNRELTPDQKTILGKLNGWVEKKETVELPISANPRDPNSRLIDFGSIKIPLKAAWLPPLGQLRKIVFYKTARGKIFASPVNPEELPEGEYTPSKQYFFRASLRESKKTGRFYFRLPSGIVLVPLSQEEWKKRTKPEDIGITFDLTGWPRATSFIVVPKFGFDGIYDTDQLASVKKPEAEVVKVERSAGLIRMRAEYFDKPEQRFKETLISVSAATLLGILPEEDVDEKTLSRKAARAKAAFQPSSQDRMEFSEGYFLAQSAYNAAIGEATSLIKELINKGEWPPLVMKEAEETEEVLTSEVITSETPVGPVEPVTAASKSAGTATKLPETTTVVKPKARRTRKSKKEIDSISVSPVIKPGGKRKLQNRGNKTRRKKEED